MSGFLYTLAILNGMCAYHNLSGSETMQWVNLAICIGDLLAGFWWEVKKK